MVNEAHVQCGECGRRMKRATRVHDGVRFCAACYKRKFRRKPCGRCGRPARVHVSQMNGLCRSCIRSERRCMRCGRETPRAALRIGAAVVCKPCRRHFAPFPSPPSLRNRQTCSACYKFRRVETVSESGEPLCPLCSQRDRSEEIQWAENDYWISEVAERQLHAREHLGSSWAKHLFDGFIEWKIGEILPKALAARLDSYLADFSKLESRFEHAREINSKTILDRYSPEELRGAQAVMTYLADIGIRVPTTGEISESAEQRKIEALLRRASHEPWWHVLQPFVDALNRPNTRGAILSTRTRKSYLQAAIGLLRHAGARPIDQRSINSYLRRSPGQRNALMPFVKHLCRDGICVEVQATRARRAKGTSKQADAAIRDLLEVLDRSDSFPDVRAAMVGVLVGLTGLPLEQVTKLGVRSLQPHSGNRYQLRTESASVDLDHRLTPALARYISLRDGANLANSIHLFPGRSPHRTVTPSTITGRFRLLGISARPLTSG